MAGCGRRDLGEGGGPGGGAVYRCRAELWLRPAKRAGVSTRRGEGEGRGRRRSSRRRGLARPAHWGGIVEVGARRTVYMRFRSWARHWCRSGGGDTSLIRRRVAGLVLRQPDRLAGVLARGSRHHLQASASSASVGSSPACVVVARESEDDEAADEDEQATTHTLLSAALLTWDGLQARLLYLHELAQLPARLLERSDALSPSSSSSARCLLARVSVVREGALSQLMTVGTSVTEPARYKREKNYCFGFLLASSPPADPSLSRARLFKAPAAPRRLPSTPPGR